MFKKVVAILIMINIIVWPCWASDVYVRGYYRKDGTYVRPHYRSSPNKYKWDNYGPSKKDNELLNPHLRDYDNDGTPNYLDHDDDNDGYFDDYDLNQYRLKDHKIIRTDIIRTDNHQSSLKSHYRSSSIKILNKDIKEELKGGVKLPIILGNDYSDLENRIRDLEIRIYDLENRIDRIIDRIDDLKSKTDN